MSLRLTAIAFHPRSARRSATSQRRCPATNVSAVREGARRPPCDAGPVPGRQSDDGGVVSGPDFTRRRARQPPAQEGESVVLTALDFGRLGSHPSPAGLAPPTIRVWEPARLGPRSHPRKQFALLGRELAPADHTPSAQVVQLAQLLRHGRSRYEGPVVTSLGGGADINAARSRDRPPGTTRHWAPLRPARQAEPVGTGAGDGQLAAGGSQGGLALATRRDISFWILRGLGTSTTTSWPSRPGDSSNMSPHRSSRSVRVCL